MSANNTNGGGGFLRRILTGWAPADAVATGITEVGRRTMELIGRQSFRGIATSRQRMYARTVDQTVPDYAFWDKLRRGKAKGYRLAGLFADRVERIFASWTLGRGVDIQLAEGGDDENPNDPRTYTNEQLRQFLAANHAGLLRIKRDALGLADQYIVINADGSLSVPSPDTVDTEYNPVDYREVEAREIQTRTDEYVVTDRYEPDARAVEIKRGTNVVKRETYANLIGRIPIVAVHNERGANETNGHPVLEPMLTLLDQYDDVVDKMLTGAKLMGNPIPKYTGLHDPLGMRDANAPTTLDTYQDPDGTTETRYQIMIDRDPLVLLGEGEDFALVAPPTGFSQDTWGTLKALWRLGMLDHLGIPEFVWGGELSSSRSSAEVQLTQWVRDIEARQRDDEKWILELCEIWLQMRALTDPRIVVDELVAEWPPLIEEDEQLRLQRLGFAKDRGLITDATALDLLGLVDDPIAEVAEARQESDERRAELFPDGSTPEFQAQIEAAAAEPEPA